MRMMLGVLACLGLGGCIYQPYPVPVPSPRPQSAPAPLPPGDGQAAPNANCREVVQTITIDGKDVQATGIACQQPDGRWRFN